MRSHLFDPRSVSHSDMMIQIEIAHQKLSELAKDTPALCRQHLFEYARPQMIEGILLILPSYLKFSPTSTREKNGVGLITPLNHHKEAILLQSEVNLG
jgi:hypothetical protein